MPLDDAPQGTVSLVFTDVQGSTPLWDSEPEAMREGMEQHNEVVRAALRANDGYEFRTEGDAFKVAFGSPVSALRFCGDVQLRLLDVDWPAPLLALDQAAEVRSANNVQLRGLRVRMGAHLGQPDVLEHPTTGRAEYDGPMVNATARIAGLPAGGQVVASRVLWDAARLHSEDLPVASEDLGRHRLKGLSAPIPLVQVMPPQLATRRFPSLASRVEAETNLGAVQDAFIGREADAERLTALLDDSASVITVVGPGGAGKTRLCVEVGQAAVGRAGASVWLCDLSSAHDEGEVAAAVANALHVPLPSGASAAEARGHVGRSLAGMGRALLILDNAEQALSAARTCIDAWRGASDECQLLVTSREALGLPGERVYELNPLSRADAEQLFVERARSARPSLALDAEREAIREIVDRLDGMPLAIELAAARVDVLSPSAIAKRLTERFKLLSRGGNQQRGERATLRGTLDHSWELLSEHERRALAQVSVFEGGFSIEAAEGVIDVGDGDDVPWAIDVVQDLRKKSLLRTRSSSDDVRLDVYETVRAYAAEKLDGLGARAETQQRHAAWYAEAAGRWLRALRGVTDLEAHFALQADVQNLWAAWERSRETDPRAALRAFAGAAYTLVNEPRVDLADAYDAAVERARAIGDDERLAELLVGRSDLWRNLAKPVRAVEDLEEAVALRSGGATVELAEALMQLGLSQMQIDGGTDDAKETLARFEELLSDTGETRLLGRAKETLGFLELILGHLEEAEPLLSDAYELSLKSGARLRQSTCSLGLGLLLLQLDRDEEALMFLRESTASFAAIGDRRGHAYAGTFGAYEHALTGDEAAARAALERGRRGIAPLPLPGWQANARVGEGTLHVGLAKHLIGLGDLAAARARLDRARAAHKELSSLPAPNQPGKKLVDVSQVLRISLVVLKRMIENVDASVRAG
jgi:predicted ATPase/class 3 adenylate cyclase